MIQLDDKNTYKDYLINKYENNRNCASLVEDVLKNTSQYELYVRNQLTNFQNWSLDYDIERKTGKLHLNDSTLAFSKILDTASYSDSRMVIEAPFLKKNLSLNKSSKVYDVCLGTGATTIGLKRLGINHIISNDIDDEMIKIAKKHALEEDVSLIIDKYDWREMGDTSMGNADAILCLGNSLTYIMRPHEHERIINLFYGMLNEGGKLAIDIRNYTELLRGNFQNKGTGPYKEMESISIDPILVHTDMAVLRYGLKDGSVEKTDLLLYPFKDGEIECWMRNSGFKDIKIYGDYKEKFDSKTVDFYTIIGTKT